MELGRNGQFLFFQQCINFNSRVHQWLRRFFDRLIEFVGFEKSIKNRFVDSGQWRMRGLRQTHHIEMPGQSWGELVTTPTGRTAGADKGCIFNPFPVSFLSVPDTLLVDEASKHLDCRNGPVLLLRRHIHVIDGNDRDRVVDGAQQILLQFLQLRLDGQLELRMWGCWGQHQGGRGRLVEVDAFACAWWAGYQYRVWSGRQKTNNWRVTNGVYCFNYNFMETLFLLINKRS